MSARVLFLSRGDRGARLRAVRLTGERSDVRYPETGALEGVAEDFPPVAAWVREQLDRTRSSTGIAQLCVDVEGGVCAWLSAPSAEPAVVAASARMGSGDGAPPAGGALDYYAPDDRGATLQALGQRGGDGVSRLAVLGITDVPARLLIDALDRARVPVESVSTLWHAMARAWDPGAPRGAERDAPLADPGPVCAVLVVDPEGRLLWCWSWGGRVLCAGAMRVRTSAPDGAVHLGADEASRLTAEWLSWGVQLGRVPGRVVGVLPDAAAGDEDFVRALVASWAKAPFDAVRVADPVGETLARLARALEDTPRAFALSDDPSTGLPALANRPGAAHRRMHLARAAALMVAAGGVAIGVWQLSRASEAARRAADDWKARWTALIAEVSPEAARPRPGVTPLAQLEDEVRRLERAAAPVVRTDQTQPVMQEFETISLVLASAGCDLEDLDLDSTTRVRVVTIVRSAQQAEAILEGFRRVGGSHVDNWTLQVRDVPGGAERRVRAEYRADWATPAPRSGGNGA
ncbi:MAG: hypothetical protein SFY69_02270 [Planctomycetota bacterium]|nr:hypothetical protein [Planctomycetota bacterium]